MAHRIGQIHFYRGVNFGADNWLVFKKVTVDQVTTGATDSSKEKDETNSNGTANGKVDTDTNLIPVGVHILCTWIRYLSHNHSDRRCKQCVQW